MRDGKSAKDKGYSLRDWFKGGGWVQAGGKYDGKPCAKQPGQKTKPYCRDPDDRASLDKDERNKRAAKKRKEDPNPNRKGKAKMVTQEQKQYKVGDTIPASATKPKPKPTGAAKFKFSIDKTGLEGPKSPLPEEKDHEVAMAQSQLSSAEKNIKDLKKKLGNKEKNIPAWVQAKITDTDHNMDAASSYLTKEAAGEKDACYKKVKSRYSVWPSAYASGALVKCRKVGAKNWGNKKEEVSPIVAKVLDEGFPNVQGTLNPWEDPKTGKSGIKIGPGDKPGTTKEYGPLKGGVFIKKAQTQKKPTTQVAHYEPEGEMVDEKCWTGYKQEGMKKKGKKMVPNCVPVNENIKRVQTNGRVYTVMVNFYGKYYTIRLFFSGAEQPSREEINTAVAKIYPTGKVLAYYPAMNTVGSDNYVIAREEAECKPEPKGGNTTYDSSEKRRRNYLLNIGVIGEGAAWTKKSGKSESGGLNEKGRKSYERENPGSDLKAPSKKVGNPRRASFCARMKGMKKKLTSKKTASDPNSRINKSLRAWNC